MERHSNLKQREFQYGTFLTFMGQCVTLLKPFGRRRSKRMWNNAIPPCVWCIEVR